MNKVVEFLIAYFFKISLWFRYRIKVVGLENLNTKNLPKPGGILFLPSHPTYYVDPIINTLAVWPKYSIRPMVVEYMYYAKWAHPVMKFLNALPIPNFSFSSNSLKRKKSEKVIQEVMEGLRTGTNFMIYPAGGVKHTAFEAVGGASGAHRILQEVPEANVVLVRIKGLWGSSFSRAIISKPQSLGEVCSSFFRLLFKNLIFFAPRRQVVVELLPAPADFPWKASRMEFNRYLEQWYNRPDGLTAQTGEHPGDSLILVSYSRWRNEFLPVRNAKALDEGIDLSAVPDAVRKKVIQKLAQITELNPDAIKPDMHLATDLGMDSLDTAEMASFLSDEFDVQGVPVNELTTVSRILGIASKAIVVEQEAESEEGKYSKWIAKLPHERVSLPPGDTIQEAFLNSSSERKKWPACVDARSGVLTYKQMRLRAILLAEKIRHLPGEYIGIMLPASVGVEVVIIATLLAGKVPLMVNWTVGPRHLESVVKLSNVQVVLTSWAFLDRLDNVNLDGIDDRLIMLEDMAREISLGDKLRAALWSLRTTKCILRHFSSDRIDENGKAVLLFTSGTESMPKGVPLTHKNILSNIRAAINSIPIYHDDILYGFLPPFHSFGFTITSLMGPLIGIRVAFSPNPTDGLLLAKGIKQWRPTILCGAPTFLKGMLKSTPAEDLTQVRLCVSGAEKAPAELFALAIGQIGNDCVLEGYGITECSPVLTFNRVGEKRVGVGKPLPGVDLLIVHPETMEVIDTGAQGMILASGPNIFTGYINPGVSSPFVTLNGKQWYKTGDLGMLDEEGNLTISGRLKRFIKIGGEMVSLAALEDALLQWAQKQSLPLNAEGPSLAICAKEEENEKAKIFLFSVPDVALDDANKALKEAGFSNLIKLTSIIRLGEIPIMGTGKINYRVLQSQYLA